MTLGLHNSIDIKLEKRPEVISKTIKPTQQNLRILYFIFDFHTLTATQLARFTQKKIEPTRQLYRILRKMWLADIVDRIPILLEYNSNPEKFYCISKNGINYLIEHLTKEYQHIKVSQIKHSRSYIRMTFMKHVYGVAEIASLEKLAMNFQKNIEIKFMGSLTTKEHRTLNKKRVEVISPDFFSQYKTENKIIQIFTEYERSIKSKQYKIKKIEHYYEFLKKKNFTQTLRFVFPTHTLEKNFWTYFIRVKPEYFNYINTISTNLEILKEPKNFFENIYLKVHRDTIFLRKQGGYETIDSSKIVRKNIFELT